MEQIRNLNMEADDMQVVLSAISGVSKRIKEVAQTHKPLFTGEHFLTGKEVCEQLYISPRTLQDYRDKRIIPTRSLLGRYSTRLRTWRRCWRRITRAVEQDKDNKRILLNRTTALGQRYICFKCCF